MTEQIMWAVKTGLGNFLFNTVAPTERGARLAAELCDQRDWAEMQRESGYRIVRVRITEVQDEP